MLDLTTRAIVLDKEEVGEFNTRVFLFTEKMGSVVAYATATRKVVSRLAAHLEPLNIVDVRLLEKRNQSFQVGDALIIRNTFDLKSSFKRASVFLKVAAILKEINFRGNPDMEMWELLCRMLVSQDEVFLSQHLTNFLTVLGFNPKHASCARCVSGAPKYFLLQDFLFYCVACAPSLNSFILEI